MPTTHPGLFMDPGLGNHTVEIRSVASGESEAHVVVRNCGDLVSQNFSKVTIYVKSNMLVIING